MCRAMNTFLCIKYSLIALQQTTFIIDYIHSLSIIYLLFGLNQSDQFTVIQEPGNNDI